MVDEVISKLIDDKLSQIVTMIPSNTEVNHAVFNINTNSASGPDGFIVLLF